MVVETITSRRPPRAAPGAIVDGFDRSAFDPVVLVFQGGAKIDLRPSKLLLFGDPPLGAQFLTSNPYAGLDWPVRMRGLPGLPHSGSDWPQLTPAIASRLAGPNRG